MTARQRVSVAGIESAGRGDRNFDEERAVNIIANTFQDDSVAYAEITMHIQPIR
jgi:hypothetical protein